MFITRHVCDGAKRRSRRSSRRTIDATPNERADHAAKSDAADAEGADDDLPDRAAKTISGPSNATDAESAHDDLTNRPAKTISGAANATDTESAHDDLTNRSAKTITVIERNAVRKNNLNRTAPKIRRGCFAYAEQYRCRS
jgi:hypothetical protein